MKDSWPKKLKWTLAELEKLQTRYPGDQATVSSINQVLYLIDLADGRELDVSRMEEIIMGHHSMYSLNGVVSGDLSEAMCDISEHVRRQLRRQGRHSCR